MAEGWQKGRKTVGEDWVVICEKEGGECTLFDHFIMTQWQCLLQI